MIASKRAPKVQAVRQVFNRLRTELLQAHENFYGASGAIPVPKTILAEVISTRKELGEVIDRFADECNIRDRGGAFSVFTNGLVTRQASFEAAIINALAPFFNWNLYNDVVEY